MTKYIYKMVFLGDVETMTRKNFKDLQQLTITADKTFNNAIQTIYISLLDYVKNIDTDSIADDDKYIIDTVYKIIHYIEVSQDYNKAIRLLNDLCLELNTSNCKHSYIKEQVTI